MRIAFIGLGMMGAPMARCLRRRGFELFADDLDKERVRELSTEELAGPVPVPLRAEHASAIDALITMLPDSDAVERVLLGENADGVSGWADRLSQGSCVIDMSSSDPARSRRLAERLAALGLHYLDAPVSGGVHRATDGSLAILVGGELGVLQTHRPLLEAMGRSVLHIGRAGCGHAAKALNNYVSAAGLVATVEALHIAEGFGIEPTVMTEVLNASTGRTNTSENKVRQFMLSGSFSSGFALALMAKDLRIAQQLSSTVGYSMPLGATCVRVWDDAARHATAKTDHTEMYRLLAQPHGAID
ncbi:MAG TPA: NAD(P)-dependent oxidoreductase [Steroidobacteraceae bacterium]|nr:NAD(P)-dependent oxidoreductase [Steroidobacteraceae bacterium]